MTRATITRKLQIIDPSALPVWRAAMTPRTWVEVPTANTLDDIDPKKSPAINPSYPSSPEWYGYGHRSIISAWCGACFDAATDTLWFPLQGGHADYAGNEPYRIRLDVDVPTFEMVRPPTGAIGNEIPTKDGQEATGVYGDGRPRAIHSYNKCVYAPGVGPMIAVQGNCSWSGQAGTGNTILVDEITGEATVLGVLPAASSSSGGGTAYDPTRNSIWWRHVGTGRFARFDLTEKEWITGIGASYQHSGYVGLEYLPDHDCLLWLSNYHGLAVFDCAAATLHFPSVTGSLVGAAELRGHMQPRWVPSLGAAAVWDNESDTTVINILTPGANPRSDAWTISQLNVDASNAVTPTARRPNGTYGRFAYSSKLNGFFVLNATTQKPYFFALG